MTTNVVYLHAQPEPIREFLRVGSSGHRQLEVLLGSGKLPGRHFVFDAAAVKTQRELMGLLREEGRELVLDTNVAELSAVGRYSGFVQAAPWAKSDGVLRPDHFTRAKNKDKDILQEIARFAVANGFHTVLAPAHMLHGGSADEWLGVDRDLCQEFRRALDTEGGQKISIDYPLMITTTALKDPAQRRSLASALKDLPFENLWLRVSGFGSDASAMGIRRYIAAVGDFHQLHRPIIADGIGGIAALAIAAFGAAGALAHGVAEKERFDANSWKRPPPGGGGGRERRILVAGLDRLLTAKQVNLLMATGGARRLLSCNDPSCCRNGLDDTLKNPKAHYLAQRSRQVSMLSAVPEMRRVQHFLANDVAESERISAKAMKLKVEDEALKKVLTGCGERIEKIRPVLEDLHMKMGADVSRSLVPKARNIGSGDTAQGRR